MDYSTEWEELKGYHGSDIKQKIFEEICGQSFYYSRDMPAERKEQILKEKAMAEPQAKRAWDAFRGVKSLHKEMYQLYLQSDAWQDKRRRVLERDRHKCRVCGEKADNVHHLTYDRVYDESLFDLVALCRNCHEEYHVLERVI